MQAVILHRFVKGGTGSASEVAPHKDAYWKRT